ALPTALQPLEPTCRLSPRGRRSRRRRLWPTAATTIATSRGQPDRVLSKITADRCVTSVLAEQHRGTSVHRSSFTHRLLVGTRTRPDRPTTRARRHVLRPPWGPRPTPVPSGGPSPDVAARCRLPHPTVSTSRRPHRRGRSNGSRHARREPWSRRSAVEPKLAPTHRYRRRQPRDRRPSALRPQPAHSRYPQQPPSRRRPPHRPP